MTYFTEQNWDATRQQLEIANCAYDEAWGALKGLWQRHGDDISSEYAVAMRQSLGDSINNAFDDSLTSEQIAEAAIRALGYIPRRDAFSLECARK